MDILLDFYIDSKTRGCWKNNEFLRLSNGRSICDCESLNNQDIYRLLNNCIQSSVSSPISKWFVLLDLRDLGELKLSKFTIETLCYQVMDEKDYINPDDLEKISFDILTS